MNISLLAPVFLFLFSFTALAQHEADHWYFGIRAGLVFKNDTVVSVAGGQMQSPNGSTEGCASISDKVTGDLLFYTDGETIWNRKHKVIKNGTGLLSGLSSSQGVLIVPNLSNSKLYYIFTAPDLTSVKLKTTKFHYSVVSLENPDGEVVAKNIQLIDSVAEKVTGTLDCSGIGFWVITCHVRKSIFYSFHVTVSGVNPVPVISDYATEAGDYGIGLTSTLAGCMKISPDRTKLAYTSYYDFPSPTLALFDFNPQTGLIYNYNPLSMGQNMLNCYGVSFSPDNSKLYATGQTNLQSAASSFIFQFDLTLLDPTAIRNSLFAMQVRTNVYAMQLAPDEKIYVATDVGGVSVIEKPNLKGTAFNYNRNSIDLISGSCSYGLPNFMDYIFNEPPSGPNPLAWCMPPPPPPPLAYTTSESSCLRGNSLKFIDRSTLNPTKREWTFENGTPATSTDSIVTVSYTQVGTHKVQLIVSNNYGSDTTVVQAIIYPLPTAEAGADKTLCPNATVQLGAPAESGNIYSWQPITNLNNPTISNPICTPSSGITEYILTVTNSAGCVAYDTVLVTVGNIVAKVSSDTAVCSGSSVQLTASGGSDYEWSPSVGLDNASISNPIATPIITTTYTVVVSSGTCRDSAFVTVTVNPQPTANAGEDKTICSGEGVEIGIPSMSGNLYSWQPTNGLNDRSLSNPIASPSTTTEYILTVTGVGGCVSFDTVLVTVGSITANVSGDTAICEGSSIQLLASGGSNYLWSPSVGLNNPNSSNPIATPNQTTIYKVIISSGLCIDSAFVTVSIVPPPNANAGIDKIICVGESVEIGVPSIVGNSYLWNPKVGLNSTTISNPIVSPNQTTEYILTVTNSLGCINYDTVKITVNSPSERIFTLTPSVVTITPGQPFQTLLSVPSGVSSWKVRLNYDNLVVTFSSILQMTNGITAIQTEQNGQLLLRGTGENGTVQLIFNTFLPYNSDTTFPIKLTIDSAELKLCETVSSVGNLLELSDYCGKRIRMVSSTGKNYSLTAKENGITFGVGLTGNVRIELYDYIGVLKEVFVNETLEAGEYGIELDVPTGVYFCRMSAGMFERVGMVVIVR